MGGTVPDLDACAREIYVEWAACQHFELYDEVPGVLRTLAGAGLRIGLISNSHRCLASFQSHFELRRGSSPRPCRRQTIKDMAITGTSGAEYGIRGWIAATDLNTGKELWRRHTIPGSGRARPRHLDR